MSEIDQLKAEIRRLRAALEKARYHVAHGVVAGHIFKRDLDMVDAALAAPPARPADPPRTSEKSSEVAGPGEAVEKPSAVTIDRDVMSGAPCVAGRRIPVASVLGALSGEWNGDLKAFRSISEGQVIGCLEWASSHIADCYSYENRYSPSAPSPELWEARDAIQSKCGPK